MFSTRWFWRALSLALLSLVASSPSRAAADETWLVTLEPSAQSLIGEPQSANFSAGLGAALGLYRSLGPRFLLGARVRSSLFFDAGAPVAPGLVDPGMGSLATFELAGRFRLVTVGDDAARGTGLWAEITSGGALSGSDFRATLGGALGFGIPIKKLNFGPVIRYSHVFQPEDLLLPQDAHVIIFGIELSFADGRDPKPTEAAIAEEAAATRDSDYDGFSDPRDQCPNMAEDFDGFEDHDGCPDEDNDADGVLDVDDLCPDEPEDFDAFEDADGCPDSDNDNDGILDTVDACPLRAEVINGVDDEDGCPDEGDFVFNGQSIELESTAFFPEGSARLHAGGAQIARSIARFIQQHPELAVWRVDAHVSNDIDPADAMRLTSARAEALRAAILRGAELAPGRLSANGAGSNHRIDFGETEDAHARNRRIEVLVVERSEIAPAPVPEVEADMTFDAPQAPASAPPASDGTEGADMVFE